MFHWGRYKKGTITDGNGNEKEVLTINLEAGHTYVKDRGYASFAMFLDTSMWWVIMKIGGAHNTFLLLVILLEKSRRSNDTKWYY